MSDKIGIMDFRDTQTAKLLTKWHSGDAKSLETLVGRHLPWLQNKVRQRMGPLLRKKAETLDYVQDAMVEFLKYGPRFVMSDEDHFRGLLLRIVENSLRNKHRWFSAARRKFSREKPLPSTTILSLDPAGVSPKTPSQSAERMEREAWVRLGLELLDPDDREVIVLREWKGMTFDDIGDKFDIQGEGARKRYNTSMTKLTGVVRALRKGEYSKAL